MSLRTTVAGVCLLIGSMALVDGLHAQQPGQMVTKAQKSRGAETTNITQPRAPNRMDAARPAPPAKGGEAARGGAALARLTVDNWTPWYIDVYVDGEYGGTVGAFGDGYVWVGSGTRQLYARADFGDAPALEWGPMSASVADAYYWKLTK
jgi:hypothetical protein